MTNTLKYLGLFLLLSIVGFLISDSFVGFSISQIVKNVNAQIVSRSLGGRFSSHLLFALSIGAIPIFYLITNKIVKLNFVIQGLITCVIIIVSGLIFWQTRIFQLKIRLKKMSKIDIQHGFHTQLDINNLNLEKYLFLGFIAGTVLSIMIFKNKKRKLITVKNKDNLQI